MFTVVLPSIESSDYISRKNNGWVIGFAERERERAKSFTVYRRLEVVCIETTLAHIMLVKEYENVC